MSRSGYTDDACDNYWDMIRWRGAVVSALRGKRGQAFLREMLAAFEALPQPRLIANEIVAENGEVCAIGSVAKARRMDVSDLDATERDLVAEKFGIAEAMVAEISYINDEQVNHETPEQRFTRVRAWVMTQLETQSARVRRECAEIARNHGDYEGGILCDAIANAIERGERNGG